MAILFQLKTLQRILAIPLSSAIYKWRIIQWRDELRCTGNGRKLCLFRNSWGQYDARGLNSRLFELACVETTGGNPGKIITQLVKHTSKNVLLKDILKVPAQFLYLKIKTKHSICENCKQRFGNMKCWQNRYTSWIWSDKEIFNPKRSSFPSGIRVDINRISHNYFLTYRNNRTFFNLILFYTFL
jgi:hypothetical protein